MNKNGEPETTVYNVYFNDDSTLLTYVEVFANSDAMSFHGERFLGGSFINKIIERTDGGRMCVYGGYTQANKDFAVTNGFDIEWHDLIDGFAR